MHHNATLDVTGRDAKWQTFSRSCSTSQHHTESHAATLPKNPNGIRFVGIWNKNLSQTCAVNFKAKPIIIQGWDRLYGIAIYCLMNYFRVALKWSGWVGEWVVGTVGSSGCPTATSFCKNVKPACTKSHQNMQQRHSILPLPNEYARTPFSCWSPKPCSRSSHKWPVITLNGCRLRGNGRCPVFADFYRHVDKPQIWAGAVPFLDMSNSAKFTKVVTSIILWPFIPITLSVEDVECVTAKTRGRRESSCRCGV
jgi:hypothetical protein